MSIKQEDFARTPWDIFSNLVKDYVHSDPGLWFLEDRIPSLGEVRGKIVLFSRFGGDGSGWPGGIQGLGIHPTTWPDSQKSGFEWVCSGTRVWTQDWYAIPTFLSIPEKFQAATSILVDPPTDPPTLSISFTSAANFPLALPQTIARGFGWAAFGLGVAGVNERLGNWLLRQLATTTDGQVGKEMEVDKDGSSLGGKDQGSKVRVRGWVLMDYANEPNGVLPLLIECDFQHRQQHPSLSPTDSAETIHS